MSAKLVLEDGTVFEASSFGAARPTAGEVVFTTGMVGYPESITDSSYVGQILIFTYPIIGNYGVFDKRYWESESIKTAGIIVSQYIDTPSHFQSKQTLGQWLKREDIPALEIKDTRLITQKLREKGTMLGKIVFGNDIDWYDPNKENVVEKVSIKTPQIEGNGKKHILLIDCGVKANIKRSLLKRGVRVTTAPWNFDPFTKKAQYNGIVISNGPGDPKFAKETIRTIKKLLQKDIPILGICLGHQLLALAAGGDTKKLKFGHRSQNQPCIMDGTKRCYITTQNHGFEVHKIPPGFTSWFTNANDGSNEGIIHGKKPFMSVQFHPESCPGPEDANWIFDYFLERVKRQA